MYRHHARAGAAIIIATGLAAAFLSAAGAAAGAAAAQAPMAPEPCHATDCPPTPSPGPYTPPPGNPNEVPGTPRDLTVETDVPYDGAIHLSWRSPSGRQGRAYGVYRFDGTSFTLLAAVPHPTTSLIITGYAPGSHHLFYVNAIDQNGEAGLASNLVTATASGEPAEPPDDTTPPTQPTDIVECGADFLNAVPLCWTASTDDVAVTRYTIFRQHDPGDGWLLAGTSEEPIFADQGLVAGESYDYQIVAEDAAGNVSEPSDVFTGYAQYGFPGPSPILPTAGPEPTPAFPIVTPEPSPPSPTETPEAGPESFEMETPEPIPTYGPAR